MVIILHGLVHIWLVVLAQRLIDFKPEMGWSGRSWLFTNLIGDTATRMLATILLLIVTAGLSIGGVGFIFQQHRYLWTVFPEEGIYSAMGLAGQYVHVVPALNLVVVTTGGVNDIGLESPGYLNLRELLTDHILPAARSADPLPANPEGAAALAARVQQAAHPVQPVPPLPATATRISDKTYRLETPLDGVETVSLTFSEGSPEALLTVNGSQPSAVGLDNLYRTPAAPGPGVQAVWGHWESDDTFILEGIVLGETSKTRFRLTFAGEQVTIAREDALFGGPPLEVRGSW